MTCCDALGRTGLEKFDVIGLTTGALPPRWTLLSTSADETTTVGTVDVHCEVGWGDAVGNRRPGFGFE